ncbi:hypothetical protein [Pantoea eucrina]|uniref:hypothetical protein n=1 Tax=Pantoea eucrina TaxID=472693 RepID=UPI001CC56B0B|nr:hypothetical protein [Pantoea eucrina]UBB12339.1 hypothetical protein LAC65_10925 [Pantoea eucrina]
MAIIEPGGNHKISVEQGVPQTLTFNRAVEFVFTLTDGSIIKGIVPAGEDLKFTNQGEIADVTINIYETHSGPRPVE